MTVFEKHSEIPVSAEQLFAWHCRPGAFERLAPPWESVELISTEGVAEGSLAELRMKVGPVRRTWVARHSDIEPGRQFVDTQISGPFSKWVHTHSMQTNSAEVSLLTDHVEYSPPLGLLGRLVAGRFVRRQLERTFAYRHEVTARDLAFHTAHSESSPMKIAVGGSTGLVGSALVPFLTTGGHEVLTLARANSKSRGAAGSTVDWNPADGTIDTASLEGCDAVVHLGGHNIACRWSDSTKQLLKGSRVESTSLLARTLAGMNNPPKVFVCASAIGFYGDRGDDVMTEASPPGPRFISELCQAWEDATAPASDAGIRVVNLRIGVVLSPKGGALKKMLLPFKLGAGGIVGNGKQCWSWIALDDLVRTILHCVQTESLSGPVNGTAPGVISNREFTKTLGKVLRRPTIFPMPTFIVKAAFGEMGEELMLAGTRCDSSRLVNSGFEFAYPTLEPALRHLLGR
jgi:uncharacterized protein (TIGR01777 family)